MDTPHEPEVASNPEITPEVIEEPIAEVVDEPTPANRRTFVILIPGDGREPAADLSERDARQAWVAASAPWHPALLSLAGWLPRHEEFDYPPAPSTGEIWLVPAGAADKLPSGYQSQAADLGVPIVAVGEDRLATVAEILFLLGEPRSKNLEDPTAADYLALGASRRWLRDLTSAMGHSDGLDLDNLWREVSAGARAWAAGDPAASVNRLRASFEMLTQARERFYPVDAYLLDICLLDPATRPESVEALLQSRAPLTLLATGKSIESLAEKRPEGMERIREAITDGRLDIVGGAYSETEEPLLPLESVLWQFRKGGEAYRANLDDRNVETLARRRFGLYPQLVQVAKRFGFRFAVHMGFDAGSFPQRHEAKRLWEAPDGTTLEALTRTPIGADREAQGAHLPWRLATSMKEDHVATLPMVHWPEPLSGWYADLRRVAAYSPVLARLVTLNDYFHLTDRPFETFRPDLDDYIFPYLAQAVARRDPAPISGLAAHTRLRARFDSIRWLDSLVLALTSNPSVPEGTPIDRIEDDLETGRLDETRASLALREPDSLAAAARAIVGPVPAEGARPGYLILNPLATPRRVAVQLPEADADLRPTGPLRAAQFTDEGVLAVVELAGFGYAWVSRATDATLPPPPIGVLSAKARVLKNETLEVTIDEASGGIRGIKAAGDASARIGQQLVINGLRDANGEAAASKMVSDFFEVDYAGPALVQAISKGKLLDPAGKTLARFTQRFRLWAGRPVLDLDVTLSDIDADLLTKLADADPWAHSISCRWAWADSESSLRRTSLISAEPTRVERPETPDAFDITSQRRRTAILLGGLAHHRRHGARMLDTLLVTGRETAREFRLGVVLDLEEPFSAAQDMVTPPYVIPVENIPRTGPVGWFFQVDSPSVMVTSVTPARRPEGEPPLALVFHLVETAGRSIRCRLRTFRNPISARQVDYHDESIVDLSIEGDSVLVDLTPNEIARIEVTLG
ncbi:glycosyl hydrolase family 38 [Isosphaeraceae bacterium EP7]